MPPAKPPLVLVGTFEEPYELQEAARAFKTIGFGVNEVEFVTMAPSADPDWRSRVRELWSALRNGRRPSRAKRIGNCAGIVMVRTAAGFGRACHIIEQCGGKVGFPSSNL